jgi:hypothetical protein
MCQVYTTATPSRLDFWSKPSMIFPTARILLSLQKNLRSHPARASHFGSGSFFSKMAIISITFSFRLIIAVLVLLEVESSFIISSSSVTFHKNAKQNGIYCRCQRPICAADGTASNEPVEKKKKTSVKRKPAKSKRSAKAAVQMEFMAVDGTAFEESAAAGDLLNYEEGTLKSNSLAAQLDPTSMDSSDNRDDVEANDDCATAVESPAAIAFPATSAASGEMKTMAGQTHHFRHHCKKKSFVPLTEFVFKCEARYIPRWAMIGKDGNAEICNQCYCFVCDKPAKDCEVCKMQHMLSNDMPIS